VEKEGEGDNNGKDDMAIPPRAPGITNASLNRALRSQKEFDQLYMVRFISFCPPSVWSPCHTCAHPPGLASLPLRAAGCEYAGSALLQDIHAQEAQATRQGGDRQPVPVPSAH
jgi:hypothetical protein